MEVDEVVGDVGGMVGKVGVELGEIEGGGGCGRVEVGEEGGAMCKV